MDFTIMRPSPAPLHSRLAVWPSCWVQREDATMSNDGLIFEVVSRMDPDEIVEVLGLNSEELAEALRDYIIDNRDKFNDYLEVDE